MYREQDAAVWLVDFGPQPGGGDPSPLEIPILGVAGLALLAAGLAWAGARTVRRHRSLP